MLPGLGHLGVLEAPYYTYGMTNTVFEGAQGLAIDEFMGEFPHVTRSMTGLPYAIEMAATLGIKRLTPLYVTRAYATRHGRGPLPYEGIHITTKDIFDDTNVTNEWQESIRFAPLHVGELRKRIMDDLARSQTLAHVLGVELRPAELAVTCLDQMGDKVRIIPPMDEEMRGVDTKDLPKLLGMMTGVTVRYTSYGSTAEKVVRHEKSGL
jgi:adenylosuccinate synthase